MVTMMRTKVVSFSGIKTIHTVVLGPHRMLTMFSMGKESVWAFKLANPVRSHPLHALKYIYNIFNVIYRNLFIEIDRKESKGD